MPRPNLTIELMGKEVKWTYGLSHDIQRLVPSMDKTLEVWLTDPYTRDYIIRRLLTDKKGSVSDEKELIGFEELEDLDPEEAEMALDWVLGHLVHFFGSSAESSRRRALEFKERLPQSNPSTNGSQDSNSETPSAGPSDA